MEDKIKLGLVLSGGGARGAYEVGVVQYLAESGISPDVFAGASIGALNAAFLAAAPTIQSGAQHLKAIWTNLQTETIVKVNKRMVLLGFIFAMLRQKNPGSASVDTMEKLFLQALPQDSDMSKYLNLLRLSPLYQPMRESLLDNGPLRKLIDDSLDIARLDQGKPLWISLHPSHGTGHDILSVILAEMGFTNTVDSEFLLLQKIPVEQRVNALLASAAIPLAFENQNINGQKYSDGGLGDWQNSSGNTPLQPLIEAGCNWSIVVHLSDGSLWNRHRYAKDVTILEVRPGKPIHPEGKKESLLNFDPQRIEAWIAQGYEDAARCIGSVKTALRVKYGGIEAAWQLENSLRALVAGDESYNATMKLL